MAKQKLSPTAAAAKKKRDLATALTPRRTKMKAENQRKRRAALKRGTNIEGKDYDHNRSSFVSVKTNRSKTKTTNNTMATTKKKPMAKPTKRVTRKGTVKIKPSKKPSAATNKRMLDKIKANKANQKSPAKRVSSTKTPLKRCHSADAACLKKEREARKAKSDAAFAERRKAYEKTGDTQSFYEGRVPTKMGKGSLKDTNLKTTPLPRKKKTPMKKTGKTVSKDQVKKDIARQNAQAKNKKTMDYRAGKGRIKSSSSGSKSATGSASGANKVAGSAGTRGVRTGYTSSGAKTGRSQRVVKEKVASKIKAKGMTSRKPKAKVLKRKK